MSQAKWLWIALCFASIVSVAAPLSADEPPKNWPLEVPLWPDGAPGSEAHRATPERPVPDHKPEGWIEEIHNPSLTVYTPLARRPRGTAVIIAPGGGHRFLAVNHEGHNVGRWLAERGIVGCVLKYRLYRQEGSPYNRDDAIADGERAVRLVRSRATEWDVRPDRIGFLGFSAGGDLAMAVVSDSDPGDRGANDSIDRASSRPDFQALIYPGGLESGLSTVTTNTPPTLLICAADDRDNIANELPNLYLLMRQARVPVELHVYGSGGHGFGVRPGSRISARWTDQLQFWMDDIGKLSKSRF